MLEVVTLEDADDTFGLRFVANPELAGSRGMRRREKRKLFSVFKADFAHQGHAAACFRTQLDTCRDNVIELARLNINYRVL